MIKTSDLKEKDIIDINSGKKLGNIIDIEVNLEEGQVEGLVIPGESKMFRIFTKDSDIYIPWTAIKKIGEDVILVDSREVNTLV
ncbi:MAG: YlmC/YmxH family sporulation protein [Thermoanaerobacteraceae bacterium]